MVEKVGLSGFCGISAETNFGPFNSYRVGKDGINLTLELESVRLGMDTAIPLGIIVNELVSIPETRFSRYK